MKRFFKRLLANVPSKLPQGLQEFTAWSDDIIDTYQMPNNDSIKFAIAVAILHLKADDAYKPKAYFGKILVKGAASQVAGSIMHECKTRQETLAKAEAAAAQKQAEDTALSNSEVSSNVNQN